jgi:hypothetical protein
VSTKGFGRIQSCCYKACPCTVRELWIISGSWSRFWLRTLKNTSHERLFLNNVVSITLENYRNQRTSTQFNLCPLFNGMTFFIVTYVWHFYIVPFPLRNKLLKLCWVFGWLCGTHERLRYTAFISSWASKMELKYTYVCSSITNILRSIWKYLHFEDRAFTLDGTRTGPAERQNQRIWINRNI